MKKLGTLLLPDSLQWIDRYSAPTVNQTLHHTLGGYPCLFNSFNTVRPITLAATAETTWLDEATTEALTQMADELGATFPLIWETLTVEVQFRHYEPPALSFAPLWPHHNQFIGTIRLIKTH
ncbi:MAG: hypothetical protein HQL67_10320 [Magnetococcales bacterium]|nr:hypothetical protein [Magnetococcales bacterium]